uniref:Zinc finger B-box domain containing n=2 Tax=Equus caballus TaxID=9796 RepID=A0A3Q2GZ27_HORSE|nr:zinc finger B-box domain-containing protein 1 isoform X1 [Equus caballus]XP_023479020.1 zinc finger B-box domain-containing protein 1 isoform X1 [Equus caballus]XP_023479021.1 zinc finger B-box domain-containing protein 1 isoform X1 [Equus caballus]XP_023479022.1 zinc finger B-box domain-containing protein 1 isoform X1 [Equus caballus]
MNTKDFVVLPWGKPGNSVKLKYKDAQELRMEKVRLELENQEMEKKLQEFQSTRSKEKEERESSGYHWKSGQVSKLGNQSHMMSQIKGNIIKFSAGKVKLKLLKEQLQEPVKQPLNCKMANSPESEKPKIKGKVCGQCENKAALLVCLECGEDYCSGCFAKIHQKGALKLHRTTLLQAKSQMLSNVLDVAHRFIKEVNPDEPKGENHSTKKISKSQHKPKSLLQGSSSEVEISTTRRAECTNPRDRLLCGGSFDEEASAQSFQEVLNQHGTGHHDDNEKQNLQAAKADSLEECEVQTNLKIWREPLKIEFKEDSLSYMEKLWLKKHRRTPQEQLRNMLLETFIPQCKTASEAQCSQNENDEDSDVEETKVQQPALFLPVEEINVERPEPSLKIVELDDTCEEDIEDPGNFVPYKVELADADSQQSCSFHDYQNTFLYENDIQQQHVFTKGKTDRLRLHLSNSSSYGKDNSKAGTSNTDCDIVVDPDVYSPAVEKLGESSFLERTFREQSIDTESNKKSVDSCISLRGKDSLPNIDLENPSSKEKLSQDIKESLEFSNLHERPNFEDSKPTESPLLLQEIALRSKPISEQYQGLERFFVFDKNERLNLLPSPSLERSYSSARITIAGDREWVPECSISAYADDRVALGVLQRAQTPSSIGTQQKTGQTSQRPSMANLPLSNSVKRSSSCFSSPRPRSRSAAARSLSRAASEISEIEYIDITDHNEPFLDGTADQQTLDSLEKELNVMRNLADPSEKLHCLTSEELAAFNNNSLNVSQTTLDFLKTSRARGACGDEDLSSSEKDTEIQSSLTLSESSTDEEEEDFLDKQHVITLPWSKST